MFRWRQPADARRRVGHDTTTQRPHNSTAPLPHHPLYRFTIAARLTSRGIVSPAGDGTLHSTQYCTPLLHHGAHRAAAAASRPRTRHPRRPAACAPAQPRPPASRGSGGWWGGGRVRLSVSWWAWSSARRGVLVGSVLARASRSRALVGRCGRCRGCERCGGWGSEEGQRSGALRWGIEVGQRGGKLTGVCPLCTDIGVHSPDPGLRSRFCGAEKMSARGGVKGGGVNARC